MTNEEQVAAERERANSVGENQADFRLILQSFWQDRWRIALVMAVFAAGATAYAFLAREQFRAEVQMLPASNKSADGLMSQLGNLGGLASLAGLTVGAGNTAEPVAVLKSRELIRAFIAQNNLLPVLFHEEWDASTGKWRTSDPTKLPDLRDGVKKFDEHIMTVEEDKRTGLVVLAVEWENPRQAADWANMLVDRANDSMRERAITEAQANIAYLQSELSKTNLIALQQSIGRLLDSEIQKLMLARGRKEFAFRVVDRAEAPKWRSSPKRVRLIVTAIFVGFILGLLLSVLRRALSGRAS